MRVRLPVPIAAAVLLPACWASYAITADGGGSDAAIDAIDAVDTTLDPDAEADAPEDTILPDPACTYEFRAERQLMGAGHASNAPRLYSDGEMVGVVFMEGGGDTWHPLVSLVRVTPDLSAQTDLVVIGEESHGWGEPSWTGSALGLCWHTDPGMVGRTAFRMHSMEGAPIGGMVDLDPGGEACLGLVHGSGSFLASWRRFVDDPGGTTTATMIGLLGGDGSPLAEPMELARGDYPGPTPELIAMPDGWLVVWAASGIVSATWLSRSGAVIAERSMDLPGASFCRAAGREGRMALACTISGRDTSSVVFLVADESLAILAGPVHLTPDGIGTGGPDVAAVTDGWAIAWHEGDWTDEWAFLAHLDPDGGERQPRLVLREGRNSGYGGPELLALGRDLYVGISCYPTPEESFEQVYLQRLECMP